MPGNTSLASSMTSVLAVMTISASLLTEAAADTVAIAGVLAAASVVNNEDAQGAASRFSTAGCSAPKLLSGDDECECTPAINDVDGEMVDAGGALGCECEW